MQLHKKVILDIFSHFRRKDGGIKGTGLLEVEARVWGGGCMVRWVQSLKAKHLRETILRS